MYGTDRYIANGPFGVKDIIEQIATQINTGEEMVDDQDFVNDGLYEMGLKDS